MTELELFLNKGNIDICLISESHLTANAHVKIQGYCCYHADHPGNRARGGSAVLVKDSIKHTEDIKIEENSLQATTVNVRLVNKGNFKITAIYCPPREKLKKQDYVKLFNALGNNFIAGGDFNAKTKIIILGFKADLK